jgi:hypothetical protein
MINYQIMQRMTEIKATWKTELMQLWDTLHDVYSLAIKNTGDHAQIKPDLSSG